MKIKNRRLHIKNYAKNRNTAKNRNNINWEIPLFNNPGFKEILNYLDTQIAKAILGNKIQAANGCTSYALGAIE